MNLGRYSVLGVEIDAIDYQEAVTQILSSAREGRWLGMAALPVHGVMTAVLNADFARDLSRLILRVPDGQPVRWALRWLHGVNLPDRVYGPELMLRLCESAAREGLPIFLFGSQPFILERLKERLSTRFPGLHIAGALAGPMGGGAAEPRAEDLAAIRASGARLVFVALGCPKQEHWTSATQGRLDMPVLAVGAAFDFHAGTLAQAPRLLQRLGLEWAFRLATEPRRLWRRYLLLNPAYVTLIGLQWVGQFRTR
jgi:exopolysaccharide biosynthesis WecB/TagA/CpsF family protein